MKNLIKNTLKVIAALSILIGCGYLYYQYKLEKYYQLSTANEKFIKEEVWAKDSDGKGYSDKGQKQMESDLDGLDSPKAWNLYKAYLKQVRKLTISKDQQDYIENYKEYVRTRRCLVREVNSVKNLKLYFSENYSSENDSLLVLDEFLFQKYTKRMKYDDVYNMMNTKVLDTDCERLSK